MKKEKSIDKMRFEKSLVLDSITPLNVEDLMRVEGGVDKDEDWCWIQECSTNSSGGSCYTAS